MSTLDSPNAEGSRAPTASNGTAAQSSAVNAIGTDTGSQNAKGVVNRGSSTAQASSLKPLLRNTSKQASSYTAASAECSKRFIQLSVSATK